MAQGAGVNLKGKYFFENSKNKIKIKDCNSLKYINNMIIYF